MGFGRDPFESMKSFLFSVLLGAHFLGVAVAQNAADRFRVGETESKAAAGNAEAQFEMGARYQNGQGVVKNLNEAAKWYRKAADQSDPRAQFNLGICYYMGEGVPVDAVQAVNWFRKAAE